MTLEDAYREGPDLLIDAVGSRRAHSLWRILEGESSNEVSVLRSRKSMGKEHTFSHDIETPEVVFDMLERLVGKVTGKLLDLEITARNVEVKLRYHGFETISHSKSLAISMDDRETFQRIASKLLANVYDTSRRIRLVGFKVGDLEAPPNRQATLSAYSEEE